ncbi:MAG: hypothetical protein HQK74_02735, partial [Desulfamplus sp.]|nr:hypothetical protein [Desulfamplus sp.]
GQQLNDFYYKYSPYAVEAIKPTFKDQQSEKFQIDFLKIIKIFSLFGLVVVLPILIYLWLFLIFYYITNSTAVSGIINILIFLSIFYLLYPLAFIYEPIPIDKMLNHSDYKIRVEGLKTICKSKNGEFIWSYPQSIERVMMQGDIVEKYWLANAFGAAKNSKALPYIEELIYYKSINVQCAAIGAMANISISLSGDEKRVFVKKSASIFKYIIANTNYWYVQKRAYIALKRVSET